MNTQEAMQYLNSPVGQMMQSKIAKQIIAGVEMDEAVRSGVDYINSLLCEMLEGK